MTTKTYFTVKEMAEMLSVSKQAIYKRMTKDFQPYVIEVENVKCLKYEVLKHLSDNNSTEKVECSTELNALKKLIEVLEKENDLKQQIIERLEIRNQEEHRQLMELTNNVGNTLQSLTQGQLADKLIQGKQIIAEVEVPLKKKHWWQKNKK